MVRENFTSYSLVLTFKNILSVKTKACAMCTQEAEVLYRVQLTKGKEWVFVCTPCCLLAKTYPQYRYGGTWKGDRH